jgi:hypothetical protein
MSKETGVSHAKFKKTEGQMKERDNDLLVDRPTTATSVLPSPPPPPSPHLCNFKLVLGGESEVCSLSIINVCVRSSSYCSSTKGCLNIYWLRWELTGWIEKCKKKNEFRTKLALFFEGTRHGRRAIVSVSFIFHVSPKIKSINIQRSIQATNKNRNYKIGEVL